MQRGLNAVGAVGAGFMSEGVLPYAPLLGNKPRTTRWAYATASKPTPDFVNMAKQAMCIERKRQWDSSLVHATPIVRGLGLDHNAAMSESAEGFGNRLLKFSARDTNRRAGGGVVCSFACPHYEPTSKQPGKKIIERRTQDGREEEPKAGGCEGQNDHSRSPHACPREGMRRN